MLWLICSIGLMALWTGWHRLGWVTTILLAFLAWLSYQLWIEQPQILQQLKTSEVLWVQGTVFEANYADETITLLLHQPRLSSKHQTWEPHEIMLSFRGSEKRLKHFYRSRYLQVGGFLQQSRLENHRLHLTLDNTRYHSLLAPENDFWFWLRVQQLQLRQRAEFYLSDTAASLFLPMILGQSSYHRDSKELFRSTGLSHVLAISGLHMGLLFWMVLWCLRWSSCACLPLLNWVAWPKTQEALAVLFLWGYLLLIGLPIPAVRAMIMLSLMVFMRFLGQVHSAAYALGVTAFLLIVHDPTVVQQLSFQLSFLATAFIILGSPWLMVTSEFWSWRAFRGFFINSSLVTSLVLLGIWPLLLTYFEGLSLEVFWLNLIMVPLLAFPLLPSGFVTLLISAGFLGSLPFHPVETWSFQLTEWLSEAWFSLLTHLHLFGDFAYISSNLEWKPWYYAIYYLMVGSMLHMVSKKRSCVDG